MPVRVVDCQVHGQGAVVTLGGDDMEELSAADSRQLALNTAQEKIGACGINKVSSVYPVDSAGESNADVLTGATPMAEYRMEVDILARL